MVSVRQAFIDDAASVARVHAESWRTTYQGILPESLVAGRALSRYEAFWRECIEGKRALVLLAESAQSESVGFVSFGPPREKGVSFDAEVYALYVLQAHQRRGIGRQLLAEVARRLVRQGLFTAYLWALKANPGRLFYEALGAEELGERQAPLGDFVVREVSYGWRDLAGFVAPQQRSAAALKSYASFTAPATPPRRFHS